MVLVLGENLRKWSTTRYVTDIPAVEVVSAELTAIRHKQAATPLLQVLGTGWTVKTGP